MKKIDPHPDDQAVLDHHSAAQTTTDARGFNAGVEALAKEIARSALGECVNWDDRTSPDGYEDFLFMTGDELEKLVERQIVNHFYDNPDTLRCLTRPEPQTAPDEAVASDLRFERRDQSMSLIRAMCTLTHIDRPVRELLVKLANEVDALRASPPPGYKNCAEFLAWCMREGAWQACDLDGASLQEKAAALGLIVATKYDPEIHGPAAEAYPGSDWFVFSDEIKAMLSASPPAPAGMQWRDIASAPKDGTKVLLACFIVPSDEAQRNGSRSMWDIAIGSCYNVAQDRWSGILGTKPTHWMPLPSYPRGTMP